MPYFSPLIENAIRLASFWHNDQLRKGDEMTQFAHVTAVATILSRAGFGEAVIAAGFCHDLLEDTDCPIEELSTTCGDTIVKLVQTVTLDPRFDKQTQWREEKEAYIQTVRNAGEMTKAIACADKIHGLQSLIASLEEFGLPFFNYFRKGAEDYLWFEDQMCLMLQTTWSHDLIQEYDQLLDEFVQLLEVLDTEEQQGTKRQSLVLSQPDIKKTEPPPLPKSIPLRVIQPTITVASTPSPVVSPFSHSVLLPSTSIVDKGKMTQEKKPKSIKASNSDLGFKYLSLEEASLLLPTVIQFAIESKNLTNHLLQEKLSLSYVTSYRLLKELKRLRIIERADSYQPRKVILKTAREVLKMLKQNQP